MKKPLTFLVIVVLFACTKEQNTYTNTFFKNITVYNIKVRAYSGGGINSSSSFELEPNETRNVFYNNTRGIGMGVSFGRINQPMDSFVVIFGNLYSIVHYKPNLIGTNSKKYLYSSKRNLYNDSSYLLIIKDESKSEKHVDFTYTFTNQDYLDAQ